MKNYSSNRAQKGKTAYRTPSRWRATRPEKFKKEMSAKAKCQITNFQFPIKSK